MVVPVSLKVARLPNMQRVTDMLWADPPSRYNEQDDVDDGPPLDICRAKKFKQTNGKNIHKPAKVIFKLVRFTYAMRRFR
jgi:hypothetical protein